MLVKATIYVREPWLNREVGSRVMDSYAVDSIWITETERCPSDKGPRSYYIRFRGTAAHVIVPARDAARDNISSALMLN